MKKIFISLSLLLLIGYTNCQDIRWEMDTVKNYNIPIGMSSWEDLKNGEFYTEMTEEYDAYNPQLNVLESLAEVLKKESIHIDIFYGAWCGDSREHVPHFMKINDLLTQTFGVKFDYSLFGCNRSKYCGVETEEHIEEVPTFVVYLTTTDKVTYIGKIEETPTLTIEKDLLQLLNK